MPLCDFTRACLDADDGAELLRALKAYIATFNADIIVYQLLVKNLRRLSMKQGHVFHTAPEAWAQVYIEKDYFSEDPVIAAATKVHEPFNWFAVGEIISLTSKQRDYLCDLKTNGAVDGLVIPIHGGLGNAALIAIGSTTREMALNTENLFELMSACSYLHSRYMEMRGDRADGPALSKREAEVLTMVAQGKTNSAVAETLCVSEHTVDTLVRRSFAKLGVTDRISAALKAVGTGKIQI